MIKPELIISALILGIILGIIIGATLNNRPVINLNTTGQFELNRAMELHGERIISYDGDFFFMRDGLRCQIWTTRIREILRDEKHELIKRGKYENTKFTN